MPIWEERELKMTKLSISSWIYNKYSFLFEFHYRHIYFSFRTFFYTQIKFLITIASIYRRKINTTILLINSKWRIQEGGCQNKDNKGNVVVLFR